MIGLCYTAILDISISSPSLLGLHILSLKGFKLLIAVEKFLLDTYLYRVRMTSSFLNHLSAAAAIVTAAGALDSRTMLAAFFCFPSSSLRYSFLHVFIFCEIGIASCS